MQQGKDLQVQTVACRAGFSSTATMKFTFVVLSEISPAKYLKTKHIPISPQFWLVFNANEHISHVVSSDSFCAWLPTGVSSNHRVLINWQSSNVTQQQATASTVPLCKTPSALGSRGTSYLFCSYGQKSWCPRSSRKACRLWDLLASRIGSLAGERTCAFTAAGLRQVEVTI